MKNYTIFFLTISLFSFPAKAQISLLKNSIEVAIPIMNNKDYKSLDDFTQTLALERSDDGGQTWSTKYIITKKFTHFDVGGNIMYEDSENLKSYYTYKYQVTATQNDVKSTRPLGKVLYCTVPQLPDEEFNASTKGLAIYGGGGDFYDAIISIYYANPSTRKLTKPLVVVDGFDPGNKRSLYNAPSSTDDTRGMYAYTTGEILNGNSQDLIQAIKEKCYDVVFIDWTQGAGDIASNAKLYENIIQYINQQKVTNAELTLIGPSMGGLITRFALASMEEKNIDHQCKLFISLDSPQKGANINFGIQTLIYGLSENFLTNKPNVQNAKYKLQSFAAKQLAYYHREASPLSPIYIVPS
ncbi:MAG: hypothetical protein NT150_07985, partial [Bacteroidetes bacterium]|nr:hypothetical protein [Bacteroidota bacterium]